MKCPSSPVGSPIWVGAKVLWCLPFARYCTMVLSPLCSVLSPLSSLLCRLTLSRSLPSLLPSPLLSLVSSRRPLHPTAPWRRHCALESKCKLHTKITLVCAPPIADSLTIHGLGCFCPDERPVPTFGAGCRTRHTGPGVAAYPATAHGFSLLPVPPKNNTSHPMQAVHRFRPGHLTAPFCPLPLYESGFFLFCTVLSPKIRLHPKVDFALLRPWRRDTDCPTAYTPNLQTTFLQGK